MNETRERDGRFSDRTPIRRSLDEKKRLVVQLKEQQASLKAWASEAIKSALARRIAELEQDISAPPRRRDDGHPAKSAETSPADERRAARRQAMRTPPRL